MPSVSAKQKHLMDAAAHNPAFAKKVGVPVKVAKEFSKASKGQTFEKGGEIMATKKAVGKGPMEREGMTTAKMGKVTAGGKRPHGEHTVQKSGHTKGKNIVMKRGGKC